MKRDPQATRQRLLRAAFREFHQKGYGGADLDQILRRAGVTKGALYYHFQSKKGLGYAVIEEVLQDWIVDRWLRPLVDQSDLLGAVGRLAKWGEQAATPEGMAMGCPLQTLSHELAGADEGFRQRLASVYELWRQGMADLLIKGQARGVVRVDVDALGSATFIVAAWQGAIGVSKPYQSPEILRSCRQGLGVYLETLRP